MMDVLGKIRIVKAKADAAIEEAQKLTRENGETFHRKLAACLEMRYHIDTSCEALYLSQELLEKTRNLNTQKFVPHEPLTLLSSDDSEPSPRH